MNREFKFRAYSPKYKELGIVRVKEISIDKDGSLSGNVEGLNGDYLNIGRVYFNEANKCGGLWTQDDDVFMLMEYTGLKDNDDVEIYENDILRIFKPNEVEIGAVEFFNGCFIVKHWNNNSLEKYPHYKFTPLIKLIGSITVKGNVYTTPEFLKEGEKVEEN